MRVKKASRLMIRIYDHALCWRVIYEVISFNMFCIEQRDLVGQRY
jgi:hypothetical protein